MRPKLYQQICVYQQMWWNKCEGGNEPHLCRSKRLQLLCTVNDNDHALEERQLVAFSSQLIPREGHTDSVTPL